MRSLEPRRVHRLCIDSYHLLAHGTDAPRTTGMARFWKHHLVELLSARPAAAK